MQRPQFLWLLAFSLCFNFSCKSRLVNSLGHQPIPITILQINDVYEIAPLAGGKIGGMARVASLKKDLLRENPHTYTFMAGDFLNPSVIGTVKLDGKRINGAQMVDVMNQIGVDLVSFGNHEFDLDEEDLQTRMNESTFDWVAANIFHKTDQGTQAFEIKRGGKMEEIPTYYILEVPTKGRALKIGVLSVCINTKEPDYVQITDPYEAAKKAYKQLKDQTDFVVGLTHLAIEQDQALARLLPEIPLIMGGHEHDHIMQQVGTTRITKADANAKSAYVHHISYHPRRQKASIQSERIVLDSTIQLDPEIDQLVKEWENKAYKAFRDQGFDLETPIAILTVPLDGRESHIRNEQTNLGQAITQAMYESLAGTDVAITNSGSVRLDDHLKGKITEFDLIRSLPYGGKVLSIKMKGSLLKRILDVGRQNKGKGGYLQIYHASMQGGDWLIGEHPLDENQTYSVAITDFLLTGYEENLAFLTPENPAIESIKEPGPKDPQRDIRLLLADFLKKQ